MISQELLDKIEETLKDDSGTLLGEKEFDIEELNEMKKHCLIRMRLNQVSELNDNDIKIFIIYIVNKLRDWKKEWTGGKFWERVSDFFDDDPKIKKVLGKYQLNNRINKVLNDYGRVVFESKNGHQYAQTFLYQAFSPKDSMLAFIQLAWSLYIDEDLLDQYYVDDYFEFCTHIINVLGSKFSDVDEEQDIQFAGAVYKIKASLEYGIIQNKEKTALLLNRILKYIHLVHANNEEVIDNHLGILVTDKINELKKYVKKKRANVKKKNNKTLGRVDSIVKMKPQYHLERDDIDNPRLFVNYPKLILVDSRTYYKKVNLIIKNRDKVIFKSEDFLVKHNEELQIINSIEVDVTDLLELIDDLDLVYELHFDNGEIYTSGKQMCRKYLLFSDDNEKRGNCRIGDYILVAPSDFNFFENAMIKKNNESRVIKANFWYLETSNGDCLNYQNEMVTFGMMKKSDIFFKDENIVPHDLIAMVKDEEEISIYKQISPILITLKKDETPSLIMVIHNYFDYLGNQVREEKQLSSLHMEGIRYLLEEADFQLNQNGFHQIDICRITENGYKEIMGLKYCLDPEVKYISNNKNIYTNSEFTIDVCLSSVFRKIKVSPSTKYEIITHYGYQYKIDYPYLEWRFASMYDNQIHTSPLNLKKPLFLDEIDNTSEKIILDTNLDVKGVFYFSIDKTRKIEIESTSDEMKYKLGEFLYKNKNYDGGEFYIELKNGNLLPLFSYVKYPYLIERLINSSIELNDLSLLIDFSDCFIHDGKQYLLTVIFESDIYEDIIFDNVNPDEINEFVNSEMVDGEFNIRIFWHDYSGGIIGEKNELFISERYRNIMVGNPLKIIFEEDNEIEIVKTKIDEEKTIKFKNTYVDSIKFKEIDEDDYCLFTGKLKTEFSKKGLDIYFRLKSERTIKDIYFNNKKFNVNINKKQLVLDSVDEKNILEVSSIYFK